MEKIKKEITTGVRKLRRADVSNVSVCLPPGFKRTYLSVTSPAGTRILPISKAVAEVLIARGIGYQG